MYHWQLLSSPRLLAHETLHALVPAPPPERQMRENCVLAQSGSQASPMWSPSLSTWVGFAVSGQLSDASTMPSPSRSRFASQSTLVLQACPTVVGGDVKARTQP